MATVKVELDTRRSKPVVVDLDGSRIRLTERDAIRLRDSLTTVLGLLDALET